MKSTFKSAEGKFLSATCPEDIFGGNQKLFTKTILDYDILLSRFNPIKAGDQIRVGKVKQLFFLLKEWGKEKIKNGTYGNRGNCRIKIVCTVVDYASERHFRLLNQNIDPFKTLSASNFEGVIHNDAFSIFTKDHMPSVSGFIGEYGTHGACNCFHGIIKEPVSTLYAHNYTVGSWIEIQTWKHPSMQHFLENFI